MHHLLTAQDVGAILHLHPQTVYRQAHQGRIPSVRLNGKLRFERNEVENLIKRSRVPSPFDFLPKLELSLDTYDRMLAKGGKSAVGKNLRRWRYAFGAIYLRQTKKGERWCIDYRTSAGKRIREAVKNARSRGEALIALHSRIADQFNQKYHLHPKIDSVKFDDFAERYLRHIKMADKKSWKTDEYRMGAFKTALWKLHAEGHYARGLK